MPFYLGHSERISVKTEMVSENKNAINSEIQSLISIYPLKNLEKVE